MKKIITVIVVCTATVAHAQKYFTKSGNISFSSKAPLETIEAVNKTSACVLDTKGTLDFAVQIKGFVFPKALMQQHFNENYMESDKFPKATFKGTFDSKTVQYNTGGTYNINVKGKLTIHGITKDINTTGTIVVNQGKINAKSTFNITLADYGIAIAGMAKDKIANDVIINVDAALQRLGK